MSDFDRALTFTLGWEGGYTNDPVDPGGATNLGIIQTEYDAWRHDHGQSPQSVRYITKAEATQIYQSEYWNPCRCADLKWPASLAVFDTAVNMGVGRGIRYLQEALGVTVDGSFGPKTRAAAMLADPHAVCRKIAALRISFRHARVAAAPSQAKFLQGWLNRDNDLLKHAAEN